MSLFKTIIGLDFETANSSRSSACAVAAVKYDLCGNRLDEYYSLINPHEDFDIFNIMIHGITPEMVVDAPGIAPAMAKVFSLADPDSLFVCHNAAFDFSVLRASLQKDPIIIPDLTFTCTYRIASRIITDSVIFTLPTVADLCGIVGLDHHNALSDADTCAKILLYFVGQYNSDFDALHAACNLKYGHISSGEYDGIHKTVRESTGPVSRIGNDYVASFSTDSTSYFYEKNVCFTGKLNSMTRAEAIEIINRLGGFGSETFNKSTDILVTGYQNPAVLAGKPKSSKYLQAEKMLSKGKKIEIIPEEEFLKLL